MVFEPNLPLPDMKARLVLNRLASRGRILETRPAVEQLDEVDALPEFTVWLTSDCDPEELRALADVDGVARIRIDPAGKQPAENQSDEPVTSAVSKSNPTARTRTAADSSPPPSAEPVVITPPPASDPNTSDLAVPVAPAGPGGIPGERTHESLRLPLRLAPKRAASRARPRSRRRSGSRATGSIT